MSDRLIHIQEEGQLHAFNDPFPHHAAFVQHNSHRLKPSSNRMLSELPFIAFRIQDGALDDFSLPALNLAGRRRAVSGNALEQLFDKPTCERIRHRLATGRSSRAATSELMPITLIDQSGQPCSFQMQLIVLPAGQGESSRLYMCEHLEPEALMSALIANLEVLNGFIEASNEPMWGIEFDEPVSLHGHEDEIVREVFSNECHWIFCNQALKRLYGIPDEFDMRTMPVSAQFPHSPENEEFVRQLVRSDFCVDRTLTIDLKHDGTATYVENNVRGHIESRRLYRIWGTLRDVTQTHQTHEQLIQRNELMHKVLSALPVAVIVIDRAMSISGINPAAEALLGESPAALLGTDLKTRLQFDDPLLRRRWYNADTHEGQGRLKTSTGALVPCTLRIAPVEDESSNLFVIGLLPLSATGATTGETSPR